MMVFQFMLPSSFPIADETIALGLYKHVFVRLLIKFDPATPLNSLWVTSYSIQFDIIYRY